MRIDQFFPKYTWMWNFKCYTYDTLKEWNKTDFSIYWDNKVNLSSYKQQSFWKYCKSNT